MKAYGTRKPAEFYEVHVNMDNSEARFLRLLLEYAYAYGKEFRSIYALTEEDIKAYESMYLDYMRVYDEGRG